jgi:K+-transporting ATPase KdpF subunit
MNVFYWISGIVSVMLFAYLTAALLWPEWFE